jgi:hypothetical protein
MTEQNNVFNINHLTANKAGQDKAMRRLVLPLQPPATSAGLAAHLTPASNPWLL